MSVEIKKVAMVGLGYIGLPTAAVMASRGLQVIGQIRTGRDTKNGHTSPQFCPVV